MAGTYSFFSANDISTGVNTQLYEGVVLTSSVMRSSSYADLNVKTYTHGMFNTVYDYPYLSSSANALFSITAATRSNSPAITDGANKVIVYDHYSYTAFGVDQTGSIIPANCTASTATASFSANPLADDVMSKLIAIDFSRIVAKDEIKKGTFRLSYVREINYAWTSSPLTAFL
jgi:hypothetical protein